MRPFSLSKVDKFRSEQSKSLKDIINIKFPGELAISQLLVFIADDNPSFLEILNTHLSKLILEVGERQYKFKVKNFATGHSLIQALPQNPDVVFLNYYINDRIDGLLTGRETLSKIMDINPNQKVIVLNELHGQAIYGAHIENGLREAILKDKRHVRSLDKVLDQLLK